MRSSRTGCHRASLCFTPGLLYFRRKGWQQPFDPAANLGDDLRILLGDVVALLRVESKVVQLRIFERHVEATALGRGCVRRRVVPCDVQFHLYRNDAPRINRAPITPSVLTSRDLGNGSVLLSWTTSVDDSTAARALTYDVEIAYRSQLTALAAAPPRRLPQPGGVFFLKNVSAIKN